MKQRSSDQETLISAALYRKRAMDSRGFFRAMDSHFPFLLQNGFSGLHGLQGLNGLNPLSNLPGPRGKLAREEALLEAKIIQIIVSGDWEDDLKPNSRKSVSVGGHSICVVYRDDTNSGYRIWEWHGHILMFDDERGYTPEYIYGNFFQPLQAISGSSDGVLNGIGLTGVINGDAKSEQVVHRQAPAQKAQK